MEHGMEHGMSDETDTGGGRFDGIDSNLTVFALANGLDLIRGDDRRRLEWFSEGLERGVLIEAVDGGFRVLALTWRSGQSEIRSESLVAEALSGDDLRTALPGAIDTANGLTAPEPEQPSD